MNHVAVIGAGTMGNGIAHVFAQHHWAVTLVDVDQAALDRGLATIRANLDRQVKKGTLAAEAPAEILARIAPGTALDAAAGASLVVEAATEQPALKFRIFETLDRVADPGAILATNTSSIRSSPPPPSSARTRLRSPSQRWARPRSDPIAWWACTS